MLNPNCSEAIMRLRIDKLKEKEIEKIENQMEEMEGEEWWAETNWKRMKIFGIEAIEISGNAPFNNPDNIKGKLEKLPFFKKITIEEDSN